MAKLTKKEKKIIKKGIVKPLKKFEKYEDIVDYKEMDDIYNDIDNVCYIVYSIFETVRWCQKKGIDFKTLDKYVDKKMKKKK